MVVPTGVIYGPGDTSQLGDAVRRYFRRELPAVPRDAAYCWERLPRRFSIRGYYQDSERRLIRTSKKTYTNTRCSWNRGPGACNAWFSEEEERT